jgi:MFS family permease
MDKRAERILRRNENASGDVAKLSDVKSFKVTFWMVSVICVAYYVAIFPFIALGKVFFERKFDYSPETANQINSMIYSISAVASPLCGYIVDKTGRNVMWVFLATVITIAAHATLAFTFLNPYFGMITMGLAYSMLASSLWPLVALIIPEYQLGTAYGICQSVQNLGLAVVSMFSGIIVDHGGFLMLELFFIGWLCIALLATIIIWFKDFSTGGFLNMSPRKREVYLKLKEDPQIGGPESSAGSGSDNNDDYGSTSRRSPEHSSATRSKFVKRSATDEATSDCEPLLE